VTETFFPYGPLVKVLCKPDGLYVQVREHGVWHTKTIFPQEQPEQAAEQAREYRRQIIEGEYHG
jgi:hypothetical protein